jgi:hypothetical protein
MEAIFLDIQKAKIVFWVHDYLSLNTAACRCPHFDLFLPVPGMI